MTLHYKDWDDTAHCGDGIRDLLWFTAPDLADQLFKALVQLETIRKELVARDQGWLSSEVQAVEDGLSDVAQTLRRNMTEDRNEFDIEEILP